MKSFIRFTLAALLCILLALPASADMPELRGFDNSQSQKYIYVTFGEYFSDGYGGISPVLWRVLGKGVPAAEDVSTNLADNDNSKKKANVDVFTDETDDVWCLLTEYIIDFHLYNEVRDTRYGDALEYKNSELYRFCNDMSRELDENGKPVGLLGWLFTESEIASLMYMPERGYVSPPSRRGELFSREYGFLNEDFRECLRRQATGTYYAFDQGLKYIVDAWSWYWTTDRRRVGFRWIVGDNGHTSVAGADREGGVRLVCYVHTDELECLGGSGTKDDPYQLVTHKDYLLMLKKHLSSSAKKAVADQVQENAYALSRAQAEEKAREEEAARLAAQARAAEEARIAALVSRADSGITLARRTLSRNTLYVTRTLNQTRERLEALRLFLEAIPEDTPASGAAGGSFEASPSGVVFLPSK